MFGGTKTVFGGKFFSEKEAKDFIKKVRDYFGQVSPGSVIDFNLPREQLGFYPVIFTVDKKDEQRLRQAIKMAYTETSKGLSEIEKMMVKEEMERQAEREKPKEIKTLRVKPNE